MENVSVERLCIFGIFAASIAVLCWRTAGARTGPRPALVNPDEGHDIAEVPVAEPVDVLGMSFTPDPSGPFPWYDVTNSDIRPGTPPRPSVIA